MLVLDIGTWVNNKLCDFNIIHACKVPYIAYMAAGNAFITHRLVINFMLSVYHGMSFRAMTSSSD